MSLISRTALVLLMVISGACGWHRVPHVAPDESRPHITWEIRTGGDLGDDQFVCGSTEPSRDCVLPASTQARRSLATVHLYLHAARQPTSYLGVMQVPFIDGAARLEDREVSATVPPGSQPVGTTLAGPVTSKPGEYTFKVLLDANEAGMTGSERIEVQAPVSVK